MKILKINSSGNTYNSVSRYHVYKVIDKLTTENPTAEVTSRDVVESKLPHIDMNYLSAMFAQGEPTAEQVETMALSNTLVDELLENDLLVIGAPMYNFSVPAALKAYIDLIARAGKTFEYGAQGPKGLITGKKAIVVISSGGTPIGSPYDFVKGYMQTFLGFLGISDVQFVVSDEQGTPEEKMEKAEQNMELV